MELFTGSEIDIILNCVDIYLLDSNAFVHGIGLRSEAKQKFANAVVPKLESLSALTSFDNQEFMFIDMALNYTYQLYSAASEDYDLDDLAALILKVENHLSK